VVSRWLPDEVWIEAAERASPVAQTVLSRVDASRVRTFDGPWQGNTSDFTTAKKRLVLQRHRGTFLQSCPAGTAGLVCCSYLVANFGSNCPFDCSYCFLQEYLAQNATMRAFTNVSDGLAEIAAVLRAHPQRTFRIGTGELADSLALEPLTGLARLLVPFFAEHSNAILELKTKSDCVDGLLDLDPRERTVVSWSVNPSEIVDAEEHGTASLGERIGAAQRAERAGYRLGFHFDPLIEFDGWEVAYERTVDAIFSAVDPRRVAWVSLGALRLSPGLASTVRARTDARHVAVSELVPGADGKSRVWRGLRLRMYRTILQMLARAGGPVPTYLCMEPPGVWQQVMHEVPSDRHLGMRLSAAPPW
jgi:spore photoproduct lyase